MILCEIIRTPGPPNIPSFRFSLGRPDGVRGRQHGVHRYPISTLTYMSLRRRGAIDRKSLLARRPAPKCKQSTNGFLHASTHSKTLCHANHFTALVAWAVWSYNALSVTRGVTEATK